MKRPVGALFSSFLFFLLTACGKSVLLDEGDKRTLARNESRPPSPPNDSVAAEIAYRAGLDARDRGDHSLAEEKFLEATRLRRPHGLAFARAGLAALVRGREARARDLFREALVDLETETHERPHVSAHVPLACWGVFSTSVTLHWRDHRHLELQCSDGVSVVDAIAHEEVERHPMTPAFAPRPLIMRDRAWITPDDDGFITVTEEETGRRRARLRGADVTALDDGGLAVNDGPTLVYYDAQLTERRRVVAHHDARPSADGRRFAYLTPLPNPSSDAFHELAPHVRDIETGKDVDLSDVLHESSTALVRGPSAFGRTTEPGVITRSTQRFAWSVDIAGHDWNWNDEIRCEGDLNARQGDLLRCLSPYGPIVVDEHATTMDAHCRVGRHVLPLVVCSVAFGPSRSPLVAR